MTLRMDKAGRVVIPKPVRDRLGLKPDMELEVVEQPGAMLLRPVDQRPSMIKIDGLWVHQGAAETGANWETAVEETREERLQSLLRA
jgi:AbrB family looped-hinge helix DNA binding protein